MQRSLFFPTIHKHLVIHIETPPIPLKGLLAAVAESSEKIANTNLEHDTGGDAGTWIGGKRFLLLTTRHIHVVNLATMGINQEGGGEEGGRRSWADLGSSLLVFACSLHSDVANVVELKIK